MAGLELDDNLQSGITYTFTFTGQNVSVPVLLNDLANYAPVFVSSPNVRYTAQYLNVTFFYNGDGSDVTLDVANEIISALGNDAVFTFFSAQPGTAGVSQINPTNGGGGPSYSFSFANLLPSWLGGATVTPDQQAAATAAEKSQIQSVATNANAAYGGGSGTASVANSTATQQSSEASDDQSGIAGFFNTLLKNTSNAELFIIVALLLGVAAVFFSGKFKASIG
jgi:hypothetical protein